MKYILPCAALIYLLFNLSACSRIYNYDLAGHRGDTSYFDIGPQGLTGTKTNKYYGLKANVEKHDPPSSSITFYMYNRFNAPRYFMHDDAIPAFLNFKLVFAGSTDTLQAMPDSNLQVVFKSPVVTKNIKEQKDLTLFITCRVDSSGHTRIITTTHLFHPDVYRPGMGPCF